MITMKEKQDVLLRFFREGDSKSKISRDLGINRRTVRRYIEEYLMVQEKEGLPKVIPARVPCKSYSNTKSVFIYPDTS